MNSLKQFAIDEIDKGSEIFTSLSDRIWEYAELSLKEFKSTEDYLEVLTKLGFQVQRNVAGIATAFLGSFGSGRPKIGILGEFDALSGLSQVGASVEKEELVKGGNGHGCGHNMLGAGSLAAAYGIMQYLKQTGKSGTVIFYGTPGEEGGAGKAFMAKEGIWYDLDAALTWHPSDVNEIGTGMCNSCIMNLYKFKGVASHAAGNPEAGRSALDAMELMNVGVQYLREHTRDDARIHYSIIDGGGLSPNVVQPTASVLYMVRSTYMHDTVKLQNRVDKIAEGAAIMTETEYEKVFIDGCSTTIPNHTLEKVMYDNMVLLGANKYTDEEWELAQALKQTYETYSLPTLAAKYDRAAKISVAQMTENNTKALNDFIAPLYSGDAFEAGSTDVGDVCWQTPTAQCYTVCFPSGAPGHSWQNVSAGKSSIGHKGLLMAGKVIAMTAIDLFENPEILKKAREEFEAETEAGYTCPIPDGEKAKTVDF